MVQFWDCCYYNEHILFFYEDGQGKIVDSSGINAMDWEEDVDPFNLQNLTNFTKYNESLVPELDPEDEMLDEKNGGTRQKFPRKKPKSSIILILTLKNASSYTISSSNFLKPQKLQD